MKNNNASLRILLLTFLVIGFAEKSFAPPEFFEEILIENARRGSPEEILLTVKDEILTDQEIRDRRAEESLVIDGREEEADALLNVLVRLKGSVPILIGKAGVGKTTTVRRATQKVLDKDFPQERSFESVLSESVWVSTSAGKLMRLVSTNNPAGRMAAIETLFDAVLALQSKYNRKIILFIDEIHNLDSSMVEAMLPYLDSDRRGIRLVGSTNSDKYQIAFKDNDAWMRRVHLIGMEEFDEATTLSILKKWWVPHLEKHFKVQFSRYALEAVVKVAPTLVPEAGRFDASIKTLTDVAIAKVRAREAAEKAEKAEKGAKTEEADEDAEKDEKQEGETKGKVGKLIREEFVYDFFTQRTGYPVNPYKSRDLIEYLQTLQEKLSEEIIDQPRLIKDLLGLYQSVLIGSKKGLGVALVIGPTGTGKSELGAVLAKYGFKNPDTFLRIDANEYKNGPTDMFKLFGATGGLVTSNTRSGVLCEYLDDPSRGKYGGVILIDEGERASPAFWEALMEFLDTGSFVGGDGRRRYARRHLVVITSNRGDRILFPEKAEGWSTEEVEERIASTTQKDLKDLFIRRITGTDKFSIPVPILNRIDLYTLAGPISRETAYKIVTKITKEFIAGTQNDFRVPVEVDEALIQYMAALDFNLRDGARPIINRTKQILQDARTRCFSQFDVSRQTTLTFRLRRDGTDGVIEVYKQGEVALEIPLPRRVIQDPLKDPELRERLAQLHETLQGRLIGQEDVLRSVSRAVIGHWGSPLSSKRPLSLFVIGLTGTGKTELGKSIAEAMFGSADRAEVIPLGHITHDAEFTRIFGSDPGYIGSERERSFEEALRNNPQGGVIIWDEASNMGGPNKDLKDSLFKKFYHLLDEGTWTSPATGTTYDLKKFVFLFTGNDGEKLFFGTSSDDLRVNTWEHNKSREKVRKLLMEAGVPQAFIGRMADCMMMKPLVRNEVTEIARARLAPVVELFRQRGVEVHYDEDFILAFARAFFTQDTGARSLRSVAENRVRGILTEALIAMDFDPELDDQVPTLTLTLSDNGIERPYRLTNDPKRVVTITATATLEGREPKSITEDLTEYTDRDSALDVRQAVKTAYHEAGHAVVNDPEISGQRLRYLTIRPSSGALGYASYEEIPRKRPRVLDRETTLLHMARLLAGQMATVMAGFSPDSGWSNDLERARSMASRYVRDWGLVPELQAIAVDEKGKLELTDEQRTILKQQISQMMETAKQMAREQLEARWALVRETVQRLMTDGSVTGEEFDRLLVEFGARDAAWVRLARRPKNPCARSLMVEAQ